MEVEQRENFISYRPLCQMLIAHLKAQPESWAMPQLMWGQDVCKTLRYVLVNMALSNTESATDEISQQKSKKRRSSYIHKLFGRYCEHFTS